MSANRYTQYTPSEFTQTYDPYPFEKMFQLARYDQGRKDQINAMLGKAAGDAAIEGGLATTDLARKVTQERASDIDRVTNMFSDKRDIGSAIRELSKMRQQWQVDPRVTTINSDRELKKSILSNMARPDYGKTMRYKGYDESTGSYVIPDIEKLAASGRSITPADYGLLANPGDLKTFSPYIEKIKPVITQGFELTEEGYKMTGTDKVLDRNVVLERSKGLLDSFMNPDGTINMETAAEDPNMAALIEWKSEEYAKEGRTYTHDDLVEDYMDIASLSFQTDLRRGVSGSGTKGKDAEKGIFDALIPAGPISYNVVTATNSPTGEITNLAKAAEAVGMDPVSLTDASTGRTISDFQYTLNRPMLPDEEEAHRATQQAIYSETYDAILKKKMDAHRMPDGTISPAIDISDLQEEARNDTEALQLKRRKLAKAKYETDLQWQRDGLDIPTAEIIENSYSEKQKQFVEKINASNGGTAKLNAFKGIDAIKETLGLKDYNGVFVPKKYHAYYKKLDTNIEKEFGQQEFTTTGYALMRGKGGEFTSSDVPFAHKAIVTGALARVEGGVGMYYKGMKLNAPLDEGTKSHKGQVISDLFVAGTEDDTEDFTGGTYIPSTFYFNNINDKWMVRGSFTKTNDKGEVINSAEYDVDVTENLQQFMDDPQMKEIMADDRAVDIIEGSLTATTNVAKFGTPDDVRGHYGDIMVNVTPSGKYGISGKVFDPEQNKVRDIKEMLVEEGENPSRLDKETAKLHLSSIFKNQMYYGERISEKETAITGVDDKIRPSVNTIFDIISSYESASGGYDAMNQGRKAGGTVAINSGTGKSILGKDLQNMTVKEVMKHQTLPLGDNNRIHAAGKYQIIGSTLASLVSKLGIDIEQKFSPQLQDELAFELLKARLSSASTEDELMEALSSEWIGLRHTQSYSNMGDRRALLTAAKQIKQYYGL